MRCTYGESRKSLAEVIVNVRVSSLDALQKSNSSSKLDGLAIQRMKPFKIFINIGAVWFFCSCQGSPKQTGPSGGEIHTLECTGLGRTLTLASDQLEHHECYKEAGTVCPGGYDILDRVTAFTIPHGDSFVTQATNHLVVECK